MDFIGKLSPSNKEEDVLGYRNGMTDIKKHPFLKDFDWIKLHLKQLDSPLDTDVSSYYSSSFHSTRTNRNLENFILPESSTNNFPNFAHLYEQMRKVEPPLHKQL